MQKIDTEISLTVIFPTRNNESEIKGHLETCGPWLDLASEIIVVDSSTDRTPEICKSILPIHTKILNKPPGLYQAWNAAIKEATRDYIYISTVGDSITRDGLLGMLQFATEHSLDLVISPPEFSGDKSEFSSWPIHNYIQSYNMKGRYVVNPNDMPLWNHDCLCRNGLSSLSGSFASNLASRRIMQSLPFPTEYGGFGDSAWFASICDKAKTGITTECFSTFWEHASAHQKMDEKALQKKWLSLLHSAQSTLRRCHRLSGNHFERAKEFHQTKIQLKNLRKEKLTNLHGFIQRVTLSISKKRLKYRLKNDEKELKKSLEDLIRKSHVETKLAIDDQ